MKQKLTTGNEPTDVDDNTANAKHDTMKDNESQGDEPTSTRVNRRQVSSLDLSKTLLRKQTKAPAANTCEAVVRVSPAATPHSAFTFEENQVVITSPALDEAIVSNAPLSGEEHELFASCTAIIVAKREAFMEVGQALVTIQRKRLYREKYASFEVFCYQEYGFSRSHAYRLIQTSEVAETVPSIGDSPISVGQARELFQVPPEQRAQVVDVATEAAGGKAVTAAGLKAAVEKVVPALAKKKKKAEAKAKPASTDTEEKVIQLPVAPITPITLAEIVTRIEHVQELLEDIAGTDAVLERLEDLQAFVQALIDDDTKAAAA